MKEEPLSYSSVDLEITAWCRILPVLRKRVGLSQEQLAAKARDFGVQITVNSLSGWESGRHRPKLETFWMVLRCMGYEPEEIWQEWQTACADLREGDQSLSLDDLMKQIERKAGKDPDLRKALQEKLRLMEGGPAGKAPGWANGQ